MTPAKTDPDAPAPAAVPTASEQAKAALDGLQKLFASAPERVAAYRDAYVLGTDLLRALDARIRELDPGGEVNAAQLASVCILLGPYRNLTTLTSAVLSLHPQCLVLNHAAIRTLPNAKLNFLANYSRDKFQEFVRYACYASHGGTGGQYGGDIHLSHGFEREAMRAAEAKLQSRGRGSVKCIVWKDSHLVTNFLREARVDVAALLRRNDRVKFMLPVRNPVDCAISNLQTGHVAFFDPARGLSSGSRVEDVVAGVLDEIAWFLGLRDTSGRPENFFLYFEHEAGRDVLERMLDFLGLPRDETYLAAAADAFKVSGNARATQPIEGYAGEVNRKFERYPAIRDALLKFGQR
ncbi:MAG TPA: hypothetical protein VF420_11940 [Casimicrobiaceae bacterium]